MVDDRIRPVLESGAGIGSSKPVLVIVDEIDGATGAGDSVRLVRASGVPFLRLLMDFEVDRFYPKTHRTDSRQP